MTDKTRDLKDEDMAGKDHETCPQHSGVEGRSRLLIWLLGILIVIGVGQMGMMVDMRADVAGFAYRFQSATESRTDIKTKLGDLERRVNRLESFELGHTENKH